MFAWIAISLVAIYIFLAIIGLAWTPWVCLDTPVAKITGLLGYNFDVIYTNCDLIAKEEWISVFAARPGAWRSTLLFQYVPWRYDDKPAITATDGRTIRISIPKLSSVHMRRTGWDDLTIEYDIGYIEYPNKHGDPDH